MIKYIDNEDKLIHSSHEKKIISALNRIHKAAKDITDLGYTLYLAEHGSLNVMNQTDNKYQLDYDQENIVANINLDRTDGGAW